jgi:hypothetical protein
MLIYFFIMENINFILNEKANAVGEFMLPTTTILENVNVATVATVVAELEYFYKTTCNVKKLNQILTYYGIQKSKMTKDEMIQVLLFFEIEPANYERVQQRMRLWRNWEELKLDPYFSKYIFDI